MISSVRHSYPLNTSSFQLVPFTTNNREEGRDWSEIERIMKNTIWDREMAWACTINTLTYISTSILTNPHIIHHTMVDHSTIAVSLASVKRDTITPSTAEPCGKLTIITLHTQLHHVVPSMPSSIEFLCEIQLFDTDQLRRQVITY